MINDFPTERLNKIMAFSKFHSSKDVKLCLLDDKKVDERKGDKKVKSCKVLNDCNEYKTFKSILSDKDLVELPKEKREKKVKFSRKVTILSKPKKETKDEIKTKTTVLKYSKSSSNNCNISCGCVVF